MTDASTPNEILTDSESWNEQPIQTEEVKVKKHNFQTPKKKKVKKVKNLIKAPIKP